jgi:heat shock protein HtpX
MLTALVVWIGQMVGGPNGAVIALIFAGAMNFFSYWFSDKIVLKMYGGQQITANDDPELYSMVQELAGKAGLPMPKVYLIPEDTPNAFATGRNPEHAAVAVTQGIRLLRSGCQSTINCRACLPIESPLRISPVRSQETG